MVFRHNFRYIIKLSIPFIILGFLSYFISQPTEQPNTTKIMIGLFAYLVGLSVYQCSLVLFLSQEYQKNLESVKTNLLNSLAYTPLLLVTFIISYSPFIVAAIILFSSNFLPFITTPLLITGVYISLKTTFAPFHLILEGETPIKAITRSFSQTRGYVGKIIAILLCFYAITSIVDGLTSIGTTIKGINIILFFIWVALTVLLVSVQQTAVFKVYLDSCYVEQKG